MNHPGLRGRSILLVEDELLIAMDIVAALDKAGANVTTTVRYALILVEHDGLLGAIMDHERRGILLASFAVALDVPRVSSWHQGFAGAQGLWTPNS